MALTQGASALRSRVLLHKKPERFHIQIIMWHEVPLPHTDYYVTWSSASPLPHMEYSLAWSSASAQGIYWDLKFRSSGSAYRIVCDLGALKWRNSASAQGKYCDLEVTQFRFHTINLVRLGVSEFSASIQELWLLSPAIPPPHKEYPATWSSASAQGLYYVSKFSSSAFAHRTICDLRFLSLAQYTVTWISAVPLPQKKKKTSFEIPHFCFCTWT